jgi:ArsR family transcriptional regulator
MDDLNSLMIKFLKVLSDPIRLRIIEYLNNNASSAGKIQEDLELSQSYTSHQLKKLTDVDILEYERIGKNKHFKIKNESIFKLISIIKSYLLNLEKQRLQKITSLEENESLEDIGDLF